MKQNSDQRISIRQILNIDRRDFLRATGVSIGASSMATAASAKKKSEKHITDIQFIELFREYEGIDNSDAHLDIGGLSHFISNGILTLGGIATEKNINKIKKRDVILSNNSSIYTIGDRILFGSTPSIKIAGNYSGTVTRAVRTMNKNEFPSVDIKSQVEGKTTIELAGEMYDIEPGTEQQIVLSNKIVRIKRSEEQREVTPVLNVKHHGELSVFGEPNSITLPRKTNSNRINKLIYNYKQATRKRDGQQMEESENFVTIYP